MPNIDANSVKPMLDLAHEYPTNCFPMMGLHPCSVNENYKADLKVIEDWLDKKKFHAIGEIGIDLYWEKKFLKEQEHAFLTQVGWARALNLPVVIHTRSSFDHTVDLLEKFIKEDTTIGNPLKGIFHCFGGTIEQAKRVEKLGFKIGVGGVITFKNAKIQEVIKQVPIEQIVLETDAPYLAPTPFRGKRNEPEFILLVLKHLAELKEMSMEEVARITTFNSLQVYGL
jgi:TatD DNase family protein